MWNRFALCSVVCFALLAACGGRGGLDEETWVAAATGGTGGSHVCSNPIYDNSPFPFTEYAEVALPERISGWREATCGGQFNWNCPPGYKRTTCEPAIAGSHNGCSYCALSFMVCECL